MAPDPYREQRFSAAEVRRTLRRAAELAEADPDTASAERALTREELDRAAGELGLPASAVARALSSEEQEQGEPDHAWFVGAPTRILLEREIEGEPSDADREDLLEEIRSIVGDTGTTETVGKTLVWKLTPVYGSRGRDISVRIRARDGRTRIVVEERLGRMATGLFVGIGVGGGIGPMGAYIALIAKFGLLAGLFPLLWIPAVLLLARTIFGSVSRRRERNLRKLMKRLVQCAESWSPAKAPARARRIATTGPRVQTDGAEPAKRAAQAEALAKERAEADAEARLQAEAEAEADDAAGGGAERKQK